MVNLSDDDVAAAAAVDRPFEYLTVTCVHTHCSGGNYFVPYKHTQFFLLVIWWQTNEQTNKQNNNNKIQPLHCYFVCTGWLACHTDTGQAAADAVCPQFWLLVFSYSSQIVYSNGYETRFSQMNEWETSICSCCCFFAQHDIVFDTQIIKIIYWMRYFSVLILFRPDHSLPVPRLLSQSQLLVLVCTRLFPFWYVRKCCLLNNAHSSIRYGWIFILVSCDFGLFIARASCSVGMHFIYNNYTCWWFCFLLAVVFTCFFCCAFQFSVSFF